LKIGFIFLFIFSLMMEIKSRLVGESIPPILNMPGFLLFIQTKIASIASSMKR